MRFSQLKLWHYVLLTVGAGVLYFAFQYWANVKVFRYRLTMEIEADGKLLAASSIIEVKYLIGYDGLKNWNTRVRGVAPMIDLGPHGTLIAALERESEDYGRKLLAAGKVGKNRISAPAFAGEIPLQAYNLHPSKINSAKGKAVLQNYPCLVWMPASNNLREAKQLFPEELSSVVYHSIQLVRFVIEPANGAPVLTKIEPAPKWLEAARLEQEDRYYRNKANKYEIKVDMQIERNGW